MDGATNPWESTLPGQPGATRFSTDDLPERDRLAIFHDVVAKTHVRQELRALPGHRFYVRSTVRAFPGLFVYWSRTSPIRVRRTREMLSDGNDNLVFSWTRDSRMLCHRGRDIALRGGEAILVSSADVLSQVLTAPVKTVTLSAPRNAFASYLRDFDDCLARPVPGRSAGLNLLRRYLDVIRDEASTPTPELQQAAVAYVYDLLAITLGPTRDGAELAQRRGLRAARLESIKRSIRENLGNGGFSESDVSSRHRLSPRYIQLLFEEAGTTFTEFLHNERLALAYRMLKSPRNCGCKIAGIAFDCGFGDVSYFNRLFRARYGATPSDIRNGNRRKN